MITLSPRLASEPQNIIYVEGNTDGTIGGSYYSLLFLTTGLSSDRFKPLVVFSTDNALRPRFEELGVRTIVRPASPPPSFPRWLGRVVQRGVHFVEGWLAEPVRIAALLKRERISLVHLNNSIIANHPWIIAARIAGIPCITHERGINARFRRRDRVLAKSLKAIICISAAVRSNLVQHMGALPLITIHNGLDPTKMQATRADSEIRRELGIPENTRMVGIVGNLKAWKGQEVVVRAMHLLKADFPNVVCICVGESPPGEGAFRAQLENLVRELGVDDHVLITGYRRDVANYVNALDVLIHASIAPEPFGRVLLEGMALSKPVVASDGGGVPEIVQHGTTGLLFPPGDHEALAQCLRTLLERPEFARELGREGRRVLDSQFSIESNVRSTEMLYEQLMPHTARN